MSDEFDTYNVPDEDEGYEYDQTEGFEYEEVEEEIASEDVDRVLESLTKVMDGVKSEAIQDILEEAYNRVFGLVYDEEDADADDDDLDEEVDELDEELDELDEEFDEDEDLDDEMDDRSEAA